MIETLAGVSPSKFEDLREDPSLAEAAVVGVKGSGVPEDPTDLAEPSAEERAIARELVRSARARGVALTGPGGMLKALTKTVIETALDEEMAEHLGYDCEDVGRGSEAGLTRAKTGRSALCLICRPASGRLCRLPGEGRVSIGAFRPFAPSQS
jgi:hypothetical protein